MFVIVSFVHSNMKFLFSQHILGIQVSLNILFLSQVNVQFSSVAQPCLTVCDPTNCKVNVS